MLECPDISRLNTDLLAWYFTPLQEAEYHLANEDHYRYALQLNCWGYTFDTIQDPVRDQVRETIYRDARAFMHHDRELRIDLAGMRGLLRGFLGNAELYDDDDQAFMQWYWEQYEAFHRKRQQNHESVRHAGDIAFSSPTRTNTVH